jgi:hypothetical protein
MDRAPSTHASDFASTLDAAIRARGLSVAELRRRLEHLGTPISESALRFWRSGARRPEQRHSLDVLDNLEDVLGLDNGDLSARLGPSRRLRRSREDAADDLMGMPGVLQPLLATIGCADLAELAELERINDSIVIDVGADRRYRALSARNLLQARVEGAHRFVVYVAMDAPTETKPSLSVIGAEVGRSVYDQTSGWAVWELLLPRGLSIGETALIEVSCTDMVESEDVTNFGCMAERRLTHGELWLRFDGELPTTIERFIEDDTGVSTSVIQAAGGSVHHSVRDFGPGFFGLRWTW